MRKIKWSTYECAVLERLWFNGSRQQILKSLPERTWNAIVLKAMKLKCRRDNYINRVGTLAPLLADSTEAYYWAGFIMADGSFSYPHGRFQMTLASKDRKHLSKLARLFHTSISVGNNNGFPNCSIKVMHRSVFQGIKKKYDFRPHKTTNPPRRFASNDDLFLAFLIGFIDGDGHIRRVTGRTDCAIHIKVHATWQRVLNYFHRRVYRIAKIKTRKNVHGNKFATINKAGYAKISFTDMRIVVFLKRKSKELKVPYLARKWKIIDPNRISKYDVSEYTRECFELLKSRGYNKLQAAQFLRLSPSALYLVERRKDKAMRFFSSDFPF